MLETAASQLSTNLSVLPALSKSADDLARKARSICEVLRAALPSYDCVVQTLTDNGAWWSSYRVKMRAFSGTAATESIESFAARTYVSISPGELGSLVVAFARSAVGESDDLYAMVESLVTSDQTYLATAEGMECLVLLAKTQTDVGKPKKAWILWRQAVTMAQFMVRKITPSF